VTDDPRRGSGDDDDGSGAAAVGGARAEMAWEPSQYKKDVTGDMPNAYNPKDVEGCWGEFWEKEGLMGADAEVCVRARTGACFQRAAAGACRWLQRSRSRIAAAAVAAACCARRRPAERRCARAAINNLV
jgi:hypothetical protein